MRAVLHLLTAICLIWCALGVSEPVAAHGPEAVEHLGMTYDIAPDAAAAPDAPDDDNGPVDAAHHHHCPVAPDLDGCATVAPQMTPASPAIAGAAAPLASRTHQPPLPPPSA